MEWNKREEAITAEVLRQPAEEEAGKKAEMKQAAKAAIEHRKKATKNGEHKPSP